MNNSWAFLFIVGLSAFGCTKRVPFEPTPSPDWADSSAGSCERAFEVLSVFGCPEAQPKGTTWAGFCTKAQASQGAIDLEVGCIGRAATVDDVRLCRVRCRR